MFTFSYVVDLLAHKLARLRARGFPFARILARPVMVSFSASR